MAGAWVWAVAAVAYAAFAAWYFNWRGRVRADEVDGYVARIRAVNPHSADRTADGVLRHARFKGLRGDKPARDVASPAGRPPLPDR